MNLVLGLCETHCEVLYKTPITSGRGMTWSTRSFGLPVKVNLLIPVLNSGQSITSVLILSRQKRARETRHADGSRAFLSAVLHCFLWFVENITIFKGTAHPVKMIQMKL